MQRILLSPGPFLNTFISASFRPSSSVAYSHNLKKKRAAGSISWSMDFVHHDATLEWGGQVSHLVREKVCLSVGVAAPLIRVRRTMKDQHCCLYTIPSEDV